MAHGTACRWPADRVLANDIGFVSGAEVAQTGMVLSDGRTFSVASRLVLRLQDLGRSQQRAIATGGLTYFAMLHDQFDQSRPCL